MGNRKHRRQRLMDAGYTPKEFKEEYQRGYDAGAEATLKSAYAAVCLALSEIHGFGLKRCKTVLSAMDQHVIYTLTSEEIIEEVWERMGLRLVFKEPFDRIEEVGQDVQTE